MTARRPHEARVVAEKTALEIRMFELEQSIQNDSDSQGDPNELRRMRMQHQAMGHVLAILLDRIANFPPVEVVPALTHDELNAKFPNGDAVYTIEAWKALPEETQGEFNGYWDWAQQQHAAAPDRNLYKDAVPIGAPAITDVDTFAMIVDQWHATKMEHGNRMLEIPEGTQVEVEDQAKPGEIIAMDLNGPYLQVFRVGVLTVLNIFKDLPFGASIEEEPAVDPVVDADEQPKVD